MPTPTSPATTARYDEVVAELTATAQVSASKMFGMPTLKRSEGKAFAGLFGEAMVFKLSAEDHARAMALAGAHPFEPMAGRPMKQWVVVPVEHADAWVELARAAESSLD